MSAEGSIFMSVYVLKCNEEKDDKKLVTIPLESTPIMTRSAWNRLYCWTKTGYVNGETFKLIIAKFVELWTLQQPGLDVLLFGDQLGIHRQVEVVEEALKKKVYMWSLPANTSHFLQPLDGQPFGLFKKEVTILSDEKIVDDLLTDHSTRDANLLAAYAAERKAFTKPVIVGAFKDVGLYPFDPERIKHLAKENTGIEEDHASLAAECRAGALSVIHRALKTSKRMTRRLFGCLYMPR